MATVKELEVEAAEFHDFVVRNMARLRSHSRPYISRLSEADSNYLIKTALSYAWERRKRLKSQTGMLLWWEECLRSAAMTRKQWRQRHMDFFTIVTGRQLGTEEF